MTDTMREQFEKWRVQIVSSVSRSAMKTKEAREAMQLSECVFQYAWQSRQPEIDALCEQSRLDSERVQRLVEANAALIAERDALAKRIAEAPILEFPKNKPHTEDGWVKVIQSAKLIKSCKGKRVHLIVETEDANI